MTDFNKDFDKRRVPRLHQAKTSATGSRTKFAIAAQELKDLRRNNKVAHNDPAHGAIVGGIVCLVGVLLLLDHLGVISVDQLWRFWPLIPMVVGAVHMAEPGTPAVGRIVLLVGALFLLDSLSIMHFDWESSGRSRSSSWAA